MKEFLFLQHSFIYSYFPIPLISTFDPENMRILDHTLRIIGPGALLGNYKISKFEGSIIEKGYNNIILFRSIHFIL